jgi:TRAP-type C4-dicarboxylate transport system permease small subunit
VIQAARRLLEAIAAGLVAGLVLVTCTDVIGRYLFNAPLRGAFELTQILLSALVFVALPLVTGRGGHVEVDLLVSVMPRRMVRVLGWVSGAVTALVLAYFCYCLALKVGDDYATQSATVGLGFPLWLLGVVGCASCGVSAIVAFARKPE